MRTIEDNKKLIEEFPFLQPRNVWTDNISEDYDYSYVLGIDDLPIGWERLFLQMCVDLKKELIKDDYLDKFRFTQIKEKYNTMRLYNNGCSKEAHKILDKYEYMSRYICTVCGDIATVETQGYLASFCNKCSKGWCALDRMEPIELKKTYYRTIRYTAGGEKFYNKVSFKREWNRYINSLYEMERD